MWAIGHFLFGLLQQTLAACVSSEVVGLFLELLYFHLKFFDDFVFFSDNKVYSGDFILGFLELSLDPVEFELAIFDISFLFLNLFLQRFYFHFVFRLLFFEPVHFLSVIFQLLYRVDVKWRLQLQWVAHVSIVVTSSHLVTTLAIIICVYLIVCIHLFNLFLLELVVRPFSIVLSRFILLLVLFWALTFHSIVVSWPSLRALSVVS